MRILGKRLVRGRLGLSFGERAAPPPCCLSPRRSPPRAVEDRAAIFAAYKKKNEERKKQIQDYMEKEKLKEIDEKDESDGPDDTLFKRCVAVTSNRFFLHLKNRCAMERHFRDELIGFVTHYQHKEAAFMLWAMKEPSKYSELKVYSSTTASRALARTLCPLVLFIAIMLLKQTWSMTLKYHEKSKEELKQKNLFDAFKTEMETLVEDEACKHEKKMEDRITALEFDVEKMKELSKKMS